MRPILTVLLLVVFQLGCKPSPICSTPTAQACGGGCARVLTYRDEGGCYRDDTHFCIGENVVVNHVNRCVIDPSGARLLVWEHFDMSELFDKGWRECTREEFGTFPHPACP